MRRLTPPAMGRPAFLWFAWAAAIIPVMIILPPYIFPLPETVPLRLDVFDARRVMEILWAAGLLLAMLSPSIRAGAAQVWTGLSLTTRIAGGVFVAGALLSALVSSAPAYALREWSLFTLLLVVVLPLAAIAGPRRTRVLEVLALTLVLYAIITLPSPLDHGFLHPRFLGQVLAVAAPALLFSGSTVLALMGAPALALGIVNGSRALMVTIVFVSIGALVLWPDRRRRMLPGFLGLAVAAAVVGILAWLGHDASLQEAAQRGTTLTGRDAIWLESIGRFLEAPLLGVGPSILARAPGLGNWGAHPHNSVFLIAAETGIVGLASVGLLVAWGLRRLPRLPSDQRPWAMALLGGGFHSMFSGTIIMPASQTLLVVALALSLPASREKEPSDPARLATGWVLAALGTIALVILLAFFPLPPVDEVRGVWGPRFFSRGIIP